MPEKSRDNFAQGTAGVAGGEGPACDMAVTLTHSLINTLRDTGIKELGDQIETTKQLFFLL